MAKDKCKKDENVDCKFKNYPTPYHVPTLFMQRHIISNNQENSLMQCAESCRDTLSSQSCAYDEGDKTCYLFDIVYDDTGVALQLLQGWKAIFHLSNGVVSLKLSHFL